MRSDARGPGTCLRLGGSAVSTLLLLALAGCCLITQGTSQQVTIETDPPGAKFTVGGQEYTTPVAITLPKEEHHLTFAMAGYEDTPYELKCQMSSSFYWSLAMGVIAASIDWLTGAWREFIVEDDGKVRVQLNPLPEVDKRPVEITSDPPGAQIFVDGVLHGRTNGTIELMWKKKEEHKSVMLRLQRYEDLPLVLKRKDPTLRGKLIAIPEIVATVLDADPPGAKVVLGDAVFATPHTLSWNWIPNSPPREARFELEGYQAKTVTFTKGDDQVKVKLEELIRTVPLEVRSDPGDAYIDVDGAPAGRTPGPIELKWSVKSFTSHQLTIWKPGYRAETITVKEGETVPKIQLQLQLPLLP